MLRGAQVGERVVVGGRVGRGRAGRAKAARRAVELGRVLADHDHRAGCPRRAVDARRLAEHLLERGGVAVDQPRLAVVVVHGEDAAVGEVVAVGLDGLLREEVALEPHGRLALQERERVGEGQQDRVPPVVGRLEEGAPVGEVGVDPRVVVGGQRVPTPELEQVGVDLDRVDVVAPRAARPAPRRCPTRRR